ncbi:MAG: hypothetical protein RI571_01505 [Roseovarius sp.]|nr:hypothetical protein [Roseovarius sp.]
MKRDPGPVFLERRTYRRRRMADAARLLPLMGAFLFALPLLWQSDDKTALTTHVIFYLFCVWLGLVALAGVISRHLNSDTDTRDRDEGR